MKQSMIAFALGILLITSCADKAPSISARIEGVLTIERVYSTEFVPWDIMFDSTGSQLMVSETDYITRPRKEGAIFQINTYSISDGTLLNSEKADSQILYEGNVYLFRRGIATIKNDAGEMLDEIKIEILGDEWNFLDKYRVIPVKDGLIWIDYHSRYDRDHYSKPSLAYKMLDGSSGTYAIPLPPKYEDLIFDGIKIFNVDHKQIAISLPISSWSSEQNAYPFDSLLGIIILALPTKAHSDMKVVDEYFLEDTGFLSLNVMHPTIIDGKLYFSLGGGGVIYYVKDGAVVDVLEGIEIPDGAEIRDDLIDGYINNDHVVYLWKDHAAVIGDDAITLSYEELGLNTDDQIFVEMIGNGQLVIYDYSMLKLMDLDTREVISEFNLKRDGWAILSVKMKEDKITIFTTEQSSDGFLGGEDGGQVFVLKTG